MLRPTSTRNGHQRLGSRDPRQCGNEVDALLVSSRPTSSSTVQTTPYEVNAPTKPLSAYGRSKLMGEQAATHAEKHLIVRTAGSSECMVRIRRSDPKPDPKGHGSAARSRRSARPADLHAPSRGSDHPPRAARMTTRRARHRALRRRSGGHLVRLRLRDRRGSARSPVKPVTANFPPRQASRLLGVIHRTLRTAHGSEPESWRRLQEYLTKREREREKNPERQTRRNKIAIYSFASSRLRMTNRLETLPSNTRCSLPPLSPDSRSHREPQIRSPQQTPPLAPPPPRVSHHPARCLPFRHPLPDLELRLDQGDEIAPQKLATAGRISFREMNETSIETKSIGILEIGRVR